MAPKPLGDVGRRIRSRSPPFPLLFPLLFLLLLLFLFLLLASEGLRSSFEGPTKDLRSFVQGPMRSPSKHRRTLKRALDIM